jgi:uncharacterized protein YggT (Ycf19 family)
VASRDIASQNTAPGVSFLRIGRWLVMFVYGFVLLAVTILGIAFVLRLFDASTSASFVRWIYRSTDIVMQPFRGIFPPVKGESGSVLDLSILFAMVMYFLFGMAAHALIDAIDRRLDPNRALPAHRT